jgi:hypothetical protein
MSETLSNAAESANSAMADPVPSIDAPPSTSVKLIRGVLNGATNDWEKDAVVRELTGEDEEHLASLDSKEDLSYGEYLTHLLKRAVVSIGSMTPDNSPDLIDDLIIGDRDLLFIGVIRATYGRSREMQMICGTCEKSNDVTIDLEDDFKVEDTNLDINKPVAVQLKDGSTLHFNYPTTGDSRYAVKKGKTTAEQNTYIISRCLIGSQDRDSRESWAKKLSLVDRKKIVQAINQAQPGPRMGEVKTQCAHCDTELTVLMDWVSLLFG